MVLISTSQQCLFGFSLYCVARQLGNKTPFSRAPFSILRSSGSRQSAYDARSVGIPASRAGKWWATEGYFRRHSYRRMIRCPPALPRSSRSEPLVRARHGVGSCLRDVTKNAVNSQIHVVLLMVVPGQFLGLTSWEDGVRYRSIAVPGGGTERLVVDSLQASCVTYRDAHSGVLCAIILGSVPRGES